MNRRPANSPGADGGLINPENFFQRRVSLSRSLQMSGEYATFCIYFQTLTSYGPTFPAVTLRVAGEIGVGPGLEELIRMVL